MSNPYDIYGDLVEFMCGFGRLFVHVNVAPRHKHRHRLDAIERAVRGLLEVPDDGETCVLPIGYEVEIEGVICDSIDVTFRHLITMPESVIDNTFPYQKGGIREDDVFIERLSFIPT